MPSRELPTPSRRRYCRRLGVALGAIVTAGCSGVGGTAEPTGVDDSPNDGSPATAAPATTVERTASATPTPGETAGAGPGDTPTPIHPDYETTTVRARTPDGEVLGSVTAAIADTSQQRYRGLSDTPSLPADRGMLFVFESVGDHVFVMRGMDFGIDIVYADDDGVITRIHNAPAPGPDEDGASQQYPGRGQYVLEVVYEWTTDHGVEEGDVLAFEL